MDVKKVLQAIDNMLQRYFGIEKEIVTPKQVKLRQGTLLITSTRTFKRYRYTQNWNEFNQIKLAQIDQNNQEKLGIAVGKAIARNFIVSFEDAQIKNELELLDE